MNFMDEIHYSNEVLSRHATRQLQMWLLTIAPVKSEVSVPVLDSLDVLIKELRWETKFDDVLGREVLT